MSAALNLPAPPVFELIAAERRAYARFDTACKAADDVLLGREPNEEEQDEYDTANDEQGEALERVMAARPATADEVIAKIDLFIERELEVVQSPVDEVLETLLSSIKEFVRRPRS